MGVMKQNTFYLVSILRQKREQIAARWLELIQSIQGSHYQTFTIAEIQASCLTGIDALLEWHERGSDQGIERYVQQISLKRLEQGFDIREVIQALMLLQRAIFLTVNSEPSGDAARVQEAFFELDDSLRMMVSQFGFLYSSEMNRSLAEQRQQARSLAEENARLYQETHNRLEESISIQKITSALLQERTLEEVLNVVCSEAINLLGAQGSTVFLLEEDNLLRVAYSVGPGKPAFQTMPVESSFTGKAVVLNQAVFTNQARDEPVWFGTTSSSSEADVIDSLLAVPLKSKAKIIGVLAVVNKYAPFTPDDVRIMGLFADQAAIAIQNGRLTQEVERIVVMEERNRLARDLHDSVTQSLYGVSLYAEAASRRLASGDFSGVSENLQELGTTAQDALKEMRLLIYELRPPVLEHEGLEAALQARLDAVEGRAGLKTELLVDLGDRLPEQIEEGFYRIAQEALNNVLKHAQARNVKISLKASDHRASLVITDDGTGFMVDSGFDKGGIGLSSMIERAERLGGKLSITSSPDKGSCIRVEVDL